jgi:hypothetical protein
MTLLWTERVARKGETRYAYEVLVGNLLKIRSFGRSRILEGNFKMDLLKLHNITINKVRKFPPRKTKIIPFRGK